MGRDPTGTMPVVHEHEREPPAPEADAALEDALWRTDNVVLTTVGIDIGTTTSHLMFSRVQLRRRMEDYASRFIVVRRETLHRSRILLTPYRADGLIDAAGLRAFVRDAYRESGLPPEAVDAGAVILTGIALERANARSIAELFAREGGQFVCASAGHGLEALLAAHGSGAARMSRERGAPVLNVDVGGGTTKLALAVAGEVVATMAIAAGSRLLPYPDAEAERRLIGEALADRIIAATWRTVSPEHVLAGSLPEQRPGGIVFSGGVAELLNAPAGPFGDVGPELAAALRLRFDRLPAPVIPADERIRATVVGASQYSVQLSGSTVHVSEPSLLPMRDVPVVALALPEGEPDPVTIRGRLDRSLERLGLERSAEPVAVGLRWRGEPGYASLRAIATAIAAWHLSSPRRAGPLVVATEGDIGRSLGAMLADEMGVGSVLAIDGLEVVDLDYVDIGARILPADVVPVVVKSLLFPGAVPPSRAV